MKKILMLSALTLSAVSLGHGSEGFYIKGSLGFNSLSRNYDIGQKKSSEMLDNITVKKKRASSLQFGAAFGGIGYSFAPFSGVKNFSLGVESSVFYRPIKIVTDIKGEIKAEESTSVLAGILSGSARAANSSLNNSFVSDSNTEFSIDTNPHVADPANRSQVSGERVVHGQSVIEGGLGASLSVLPTFQLSEKVSVYGKVGIEFIQYSETKTVTTINQSLASTADAVGKIVQESSKIIPLINVGIGAEYAVNKTISVGAEFSKSFGKLPSTTYLTTVKFKF